MELLWKSQVQRMKRHLSSMSSYSIHSRTHFGGAWGRRELKESPIHGPKSKVSPLRLLPENRRIQALQTVTRGDHYLLFYCYHFLYCEELFYGHIALLVIIAEGNGHFLVRLLQANRDNSLEITHFKFLKKLGSGSFGTVFLAKHPVRDILVAVKKVLAMRINKVQARDALRIMIEKEASCHIQGNPHVIQLFDTFTVTSGPNQAFYFVYEYADGGDLEGLISRIHNGLTYGQNGWLFYEKQWINTIENNSYVMLFTKYLSPQILMGVSALHERGIIHLDLKPENILITKKGIVKVSDLGLVKRYRWFHYSARAEFLTSLNREVYENVGNDDEVYVAGTLPYMEPELRGKFIECHSGIPRDLFNYNITYKADYFSVGLIIFELMTGFIYGHEISYQIPGQLEYINNILHENANLPLIALTAYKSVFLPYKYKKLRLFGGENLYNLTNGKDEGIIDLLLSTMKPRKKRWMKYTIPVKVKRDGNKLEESVLCIKRIQENIPLFRDVNFEAITFNGIPNEILEMLNTPEPLYNEFVNSDDFLKGKIKHKDEVYKWPYFDFHLPAEDDTYENMKEKDNFDDSLTTKDLNTFKDKTIRAARTFDNKAFESESFTVSNKKKRVEINVYQNEVDNGNFGETLTDDALTGFFNDSEDIDFGV